MNPQELKIKVLQIESSLNEDQRIVYNDILIELNEIKNKVFLVDGPGGTGKTFLYNALIDKLNLDGMRVVAVASSGIASLLLNNFVLYLWNSLFFFNFSVYFHLYLNIIVSNLK